MKQRHLCFAQGALGALVLLAAACATQPLPPVAINLPNRQIDYLREVKPLLEKRCTVCHSCYNSPCQLKLDSYEGIDRGASKKAIYNGTRLKTMEPTRLFTDAQTTAEWRTKHFFGVTENTAAGGFNDSIMIQLLAHKMKNPKSAGEYRSEADDLTCSENGSEVAGYLEKHPNNGMPFGFPPLKQEEFDLVAGWLAQGAHGPTPEQQRTLETPQPADAAAIAAWEAFFNQDDPKYAMTARYLYEHLFLAHITFGTASQDYYELVRSRTAPGSPIDLIPSIRPFDDPGVPQFFYRFRKIHSTIVQKTHMVYEFNDARMRRYRELFLEPPWLETPHRVGYDTKLSANPFAAFAQIPPRSRYRFLLDDSRYVLMTFIQGPVCKGQIALNVIDDQFWVMFMDPDHDLAVRYPGFLKLQTDNLALPIEKGSDQEIFSALKNKHKKRELAYYRARQEFYQALDNEGLGYDAIWKGATAADEPLLTVYRHFDSASVHRGALGNLPKTLWVIDFPLLERIYYALVAGFDVYGAVGHQLAIRLYMDRLRVEGESYFLDFLPPERRSEIMQSWYADIKLKDVDYEPSGLPAGTSFTTTDPKREFVEHLVDGGFPRASGIAFDPVNYLRAGEPYPTIPERYETIDDYLRGFRAASKPGTAFVALVNDHSANLAYLRIRLKTGQDIVASLVVNRWHDNVAFFYGEDGRLNPSRDNIELVRGLVGTYPNLFLDVRQEDVPDFLDLLVHFDTSEQSRARLAKYGINRADARFWETYDWFQKRFDEDEPVRGGLLDLNRYYFKAQ
jgi:hypothetical protein